MRQRRLIIDADVFIYQAAIRHTQVMVSEEQSQDGLPLWMWQYLDPNVVLADVWEDIKNLQLQYQADIPMVAITDSERNFRLDIDPDYKGNRKHTMKPMGIGEVRQAMADDQDVYFKPTLEADDVVGILATLPKYADDEVIIWSQDKDLKTIPGTHADIKKGNGAVMEVTKEQADHFFMEQILAGDSVDNIPGIPGVGMTIAKKHLKACGYTWDSIMALATRHNLDETYMLRQARLVRILRAHDYDFKHLRPILWRP